MSDSGVSALVSRRVYPNVAPTSAILPHVVYERTGASRIDTTTGSIGLVEASVQIVCWARTYDAMLGLVDAVRTCLNGYTGSDTDTTIDAVRLDNESDIPLVTEDNEEMSEYGRVLDFTIWYRE